MDPCILFGGLLDRCAPHSYTLIASIGNTLLTGNTVEQKIDSLTYLQKVSNIMDIMSIASFPTSLLLPQRSCRLQYLGIFCASKKG